MLGGSNVSDSKIEWTNKTWNPVTGCTKVSPGCDNCYAETVTNRFKRGPFDQIRLHSNRLDEPFHWHKPQKIFVCSMSDLFHPEVPFDFVLEVFVKMLQSSQHTYQLLTKRPGRMAYFADHVWPKYSPSGEWPENIWVGTSVESQKYAERLDVLARVPAKVRFVSVEPLLGPVDLKLWLGLDAEVVAHGPLNNETASALVDLGRAAARKFHGIQWVIAGGESGHNARPAHPDWFRQIRDDCQAAGVPFFFKQWGQWRPAIGAALGSRFKLAGIDISGKFVAGDIPVEEVSEFVVKTGKKAAGAMLDGREWREFPDA